jgi:flagellar hook-associated protein 2
VTNKSTSIQGAIKRNATEQEKVNDRASRIEKQLRQQYSALDVKMAQMGSLGSYVTAQLAQWNKTSS